MLCGVQVYHQAGGEGHVTKFDGLDHAIINMGNGILVTQELLYDFLEQASRNHLTMKGYFDGKVKQWRKNLFGCEGICSLIHCFVLHVMIMSN